jgi:hypothetical protein
MIVIVDAGEGGVHGTEAIVACEEGVECGHLTLG